MGRLNSIVLFAICLFATTKGETSFGSLSKAKYNENEIEACDRICNQGQDVHYHDKCVYGPHLYCAIIDSDIYHAPSIDVAEFKPCMASCLDYDDAILGLYIQTEVRATDDERQPDREEGAYSRHMTKKNAVSDEYENFPYGGSDSDSYVASEGEYDSEGYDRYDSEGYDRYDSEGYDRYDSEGNGEYDSEGYSVYDSEGYSLYDSEGYGEYDSEGYGEYDSEGSDDDESSSNRFTFPFS